MNVVLAEATCPDPRQFGARVESVVCVRAAARRGGVWDYLAAVIIDAHNLVCGSCMQSRQVVVHTHVTLHATD